MASIASKGMFVWRGTSRARTKIMTAQFLNKLQSGMNRLRTILY